MGDAPSDHQIVPLLIRILEVPDVRAHVFRYLNVCHLMVLRRISKIVTSSLERCAVPLRIFPHREQRYWRNINNREMQLLYRCFPSAISLSHCRITPKVNFRLLANSNIPNEIRRFYCSQSSRISDYLRPSCMTAPRYLFSGVPQ